MASEKINQLHNDNDDEKYTYICLIADLEVSEFPNLLFYVQMKAKNWEYGEEMDKSNNIQGFKIRKLRIMNNYELNNMS